MSLQLNAVKVFPGYYEIALNGRLDHQTNTVLERAIEDLLATQARGIRLDVGQLTYISSEGLRTLRVLERTLKQRNGVFQLVNLQPQVQKVIDTFKALPREIIFASREEADAYIDWLIEQESRNQAN